MQETRTERRFTKTLYFEQLKCSSGEAMKFCPNCGIELKFQQAKFCPECGAPLSNNESPKTGSPISKSFEEPTIPGADINVYELGKKLEDVVESIYKSKGYVTQRRQRIEGESGTKSEIDIVAKRGNRIIAIECKNYTDAVGIDKVRDFSEKLRDLHLEGVFIALSGLTQGAEQFAESRHIETIDSGELMEKWWTISVGRGESARGQSLILEYALPLNVSFTQATKINLLNKEKVKVSGAELIFHPYFFAEYAFKAQFKDPTKELHKFQDSDKLFVDALDGKVLNPMPEKGLGILKAIKNISSSSARAENARTQKLLTELKSKNPLPHYNIQIEENYRANKLKPAISLKQATESVLDFVIQKNTTEIAYTPKSQEDEWLSQSHKVTFIPKRSDIRILNKDVVILPRWSIEFESSKRTYRREILACSGAVLEDTMLYCPKHFRIGAISFSQKQSIAVCEVCGESLCEEHVTRCAICNKWLCEEDGFECEACKNRFCKEHEHLECPICGGQICYSCVKTCPICHSSYSPNHSVTCDKCKRSLCPSCVMTTGLIRKNRICKNCGK